TKVHRTSADVWGTCTFHEYTARCPNRASTVRAHNWVVLGALLPESGRPAHFVPVAGHRSYSLKALLLRLLIVVGTSVIPLGWWKNACLHQLVETLRKTWPRRLPTRWASPKARPGRSSSRSLRASRRRCCTRTSRTARTAPSARSGRASRAAGGRT